MLGLTKRIFLEPCEPQESRDARVDVKVCLRLAAKNRGQRRVIPLFDSELQEAF
jgi:hypothetical protein